MIFFGCLTVRNMKRLRARILPVNGTLTGAFQQRKRRDIDLLKMVLTEAMVYLILTSAYPFMFLYTTATANITKSTTRLQIESFISFMSNSFLQYLNTGSCFFIYISTSRTFRSEVKKLILSRGRENTNSSISPGTAQRELITRK